MTNVNDDTSPGQYCESEPSRREPFTPEILRSAHDARLPPLYAFPPGPEHVDTTHLRALIPAMFAQLWAMFTPERLVRGTITHLHAIRRAVYALYRLEKQNYCTSLLRALRHDPVWQAQVRDDLGGDAAMARWEKRWEKRWAKQESMREPETIQAPPRPHNPQRRRPATPSEAPKDRCGLFRLAPVPHAKSAPHIHTRTPGPRLRSLTFAALSPKPVPVTPDDLRPRAKSLQDTTMSNAPGLTRQQLGTIWLRLLHEFAKWNGFIAMADFATVDAQTRAELAAPP